MKADNSSWDCLTIESIRKVRDSFITLYIVILSRLMKKSTLTSFMDKAILNSSVDRKPMPPFLYFAMTISLLCVMKVVCLIVISGLCVVSIKYFL